MALAVSNLLERIENNPDLWRLALFESYLTDAAGALVPDGLHHREFWRWVWSIEQGRRPRPFIAIWPRGGAKSTNVEEAAIALGARRVRRYAWWVSATQDQSDDHVGTVSEMLERDEVATFYPLMAERKLSKYGHSRGWRRNRLRTSSGFSIDALGLDTAARGVKLGDQRPDLIVFDDVDDSTDGPTVTARKLKALTTKIIPAGSEDVAIIGIQNLVHPESVFSRLVDGRADFLANRIISGPVPAVWDAEIEQSLDGGWTINGRPSWQGQDLDVCRGILNDIGLTAFLHEHQHEVEPPPGGLFDHLEFERIEWDELPDLVKVVVWVDPAVTSSDESDSQAIQADGIDPAGVIYRLFSWEQRATPLEALKRAILKAAELGSLKVGVETDQGGDTWESVFREARSLLQSELLAADDSDLARRVLLVSFDSAKAGQGHGPKAHRASQMLPDYERRRIIHVRGTHRTLEAALRRFPKVKPFDLVDASFWSWLDLRGGGEIAASIHEGAPTDRPATAEDLAEEAAIRTAYDAPRASKLWDR